MDLLLMHVLPKLHLRPDLCTCRFTMIDLSFTDALMKPEGIASRIQSGDIEMEGDKVTGWLDHEAHLRFWVDFHFFIDYVLGQYEEYKPAWTDVDFIFGPINIKQYWLMLATDLERYTIFVFNSMSNYISGDILDGRLKLVARAMPSMLISVGFDIQHETFKYGQWEVKKSKLTLQEGKSLDCGTFVLNL
ncbi:uncharacterized protein LOC120068961 [Benincasa hispida]|uniref:uncharacterized protein LOC120068961 n=1 Tax=Benincasa hispida TaxID=102211 RepID=UPI001901993C|nr:uncharacterized protein LOC120068961 [Benincasa hispida]